MKNIKKFVDYIRESHGLEFIEINYPVRKDNFYPSEFGIRYYVMIDDRPKYFTINKSGEMTGNNNVKQSIVRDMEDKGLINSDNRQVITSSVAEYLRGYK